MKLVTNNQKNDNKKLLFYVWIFLFIVWCLTILIPLIFKTERYISDYVDMFAYYYRANWVLTHEGPISEYSQIPTYLFGLNKFIANLFNDAIQFVIFYSITSLEMIVALFLVIKILLESFPSDRKYRFLLMLLPTTLYFVLNRFDILPALLCLIALILVQKKKWVFSSIILAIATFAKWYPILIFPGFFVYASIQENKFQWKMIVSFLITSVFIIIPTYIQGGIDAVLFPYQFHLSRGMEFVSLPILVNKILMNVLNISISQQYLMVLFFLLQIISPLLVFFLEINTKDRLVKYCIITISMFILFSRVNSPQWILWILPFLIISIKDKTDIWIIILYSITTYLFFPFIFDLFGPSSIQLQLLGIACYIILVVIIIRSFIGMSFKIKPILLKGHFD